MEQWGFYFDQTRCIGCKTCTVACMVWNEERRGDAALYPEETIPFEPAYEIPKGYETMPDGSYNNALLGRYHMKEELMRVTEQEYGTGMPNIDVLYLALSCGHCAHMACAEACPKGCITKEGQIGAVVVDAQSCIGCGLCKNACPFGAPQFYREPKAAPAGQKPKMVKCDLCLERVSAGLKPACVAACRVRALDALPLSQLREKYPDAVPRVLNSPDDISGRTGKHTCPNWLFRVKKPCV